MQWEGGGEDRRDRKRNDGCQTARTSRGSYVKVVSHSSTNTCMVVAPRAGQSQRGESTSCRFPSCYHPTPVTSPPPAPSSRSASPGCILTAATPSLPPRRCLTPLPPRPPPRQPGVTPLRPPPSPRYHTCHTLPLPRHFSGLALCSRVRYRHPFLLTACACRLCMQLAVVLPVFSWVSGGFSLSMQSEVWRGARVLSSTGSVAWSQDESSLRTRPLTLCP